MEVFKELEMVSAEVFPFVPSILQSLLYEGIRLAQVLLSRRSYKKVNIMGAHRD